MSEDNIELTDGYESCDLSNPGWIEWQNWWNTWRSVEKCAFSNLMPKIKESEPVRTEKKRSKLSIVVKTAIIGDE